MNLDNKIKSRLSKVMDIDYLSINNDTDKHVNHKKTNTKLFPKMYDLIIFP